MRKSKEVKKEKEFLEFYTVHTRKKHLLGRMQDFRRRGRQLQWGGGGECHTFINFSENCMKLRKCWSVGGRWGCPPLIWHWFALWSETKFAYTFSVPPCTPIIAPSLVQSGSIGCWPRYDVIFVTKLMKVFSLWKWTVWGCPRIMISW